MGISICCHSISIPRMQNMVVDPLVRVPSAATLEWGWEDVALACCVATALTSIAVVVVAVIYRCNKLAQQRETGKSRFANDTCPASPSRTPTRALKPPKSRVSDVFSSKRQDKDEDMPVPKVQPRTPPMPPAANTQRRVTKPKQAKEDTTVKPTESPSLQSRPQIRLTPSSSAKNTSQATVAKGPVAGAAFNFQARRALHNQ